ncbi:MAG: nitrate reductase cytochrome c-type subunit [Candidatus Krumholzibacteriota bacterium]
MMSRMSTLCLLIAFLLLAGCSAKDAPVSDAPPPPPPPAPAVPDKAAAEVADDDLSYRNEPLLDDSGTPPAAFDSPDPGDAKLPARSFENAPPVIPHNTDDLLPITANENSCTDCHLPEEAAEVGATPVPASHLYDIRKDKPLGSLAGANYNCTLCHAAQANTGDLVENTFEPYYRAKEQKERSNLLDTLNEGVE